MIIPELLLVNSKSFLKNRLSLGKIALHKVQGSQLV